MVKMIKITKIIRMIKNDNRYGINLCVHLHDISCDYPMLFFSAWMFWSSRTSTVRRWLWHSPSTRERPRPSWDYWADYR